MNTTLIKTAHNYNVLIRPCLLTSFVIFILWNFSGTNILSYAPHFLASVAEMLQLSTKITVARDWRVVSVPEEDSSHRFCSAGSWSTYTVYDPLEQTSADSASLDWHRWVVWSDHR